VILCIRGWIAEQDVDMQRALLEQIERERADMSASARIEKPEEIEHA
jgi:hypothetical protein